MEKTDVKKLLKVLVLSIVLVFGLSLTGLAGPMGTAFTYQGRLTDGGNPASGPYDLLFNIFDIEIGGSQVGSAIILDNVSVTDGLFTVQLDFGSSAFAGSARGLEISVRPGDSTGAYTPLSPRQELTPTPYAIYAQNGGDLSLPFAGSVSSSSEALSITNTGSGRAGRFLIVNINNASPALEATTNGMGPAGLFAINNANNNEAAVHAMTSGGGYAGLFDGPVKSVVGGHAFYMVPQGAIIMWSGSLSNIPDGWGLCDGTNGTPDLRDRFMRGWTDGVDPGDTGGGSSHSHTANSHSHGVKMWAEYYWEAFDEQNFTSPADVNVAAGQYGGHAGVDINEAAEWTQKTLYRLYTFGLLRQGYRDRLGVKGNTLNTLPGTSLRNHLPPYYKLAYIMKL